MPQTDKPRFWTVDRIMQLIIGLLLATVIVLLIRYLSDVLLPFFVACLVAYLLQPLVDFNQRLLRCKKRVLPAIITMLDIVLAIVLIIYLFVPSIINELSELEKIIHDVSTGRVQLPPFYRNVADFINTYFKPKQFRSMLSGEHIMTLINGGTSILAESFDVVVTVLSWLLTLIYILFILIDYPQISRGFKLIVPRKYRPQFMTIFGEVSTMMNHYFRGQGFVALCAMVFYCIGFSIVGLPLAIPMGVMVGILYMIPYFQYITILPVAAICLIYSLGGHGDFLTLAGKCTLVYVLSQCICDYVITPHVMKKEMGLNAAIILLSLSVWGSLMGIIGMIVALPLTSLIMTYYTRYISEPKPRRKPIEDPKT